MTSINKENFRMATNKNTEKFTKIQITRLKIRKSFTLKKKVHNRHHLLSTYLYQTLPHIGRLNS